MNVPTIQDVGYRTAKYIYAACLIILSIAIAYICSKLSLSLATLFVLVAVAPSIVLLFIINPKYGLFLTVTLPFMGFELERYTKLDLPIGLLIQVIFFSLFVLALYKQKVDNSKLSYAKNSISYVFIITYAYFIIQGLNPNMYSVNGWLVSLRSVLGVYLIFYVSLMLFNHISFARQFFYIWISLAFISAVYACYQEWFGLPSFVLEYIHADPVRLGLNYINGKYRIFSLLTDPAAFGIFMAGSFFITFSFGLYEDKNSTKFLYFIISVFLLLASAFSGTRTSYAMIPAGFVMFTLITITSVRTVVVVSIFSFVFAVLIFGPFYGNQTLNRVRSTFIGNDESLSVRDVNRQYIQPYIYEHPIGGGLMTTGVAGKKYNPDHRLAGFPPDSEYLQTVLEIGWFGLFIHLTLFYIGIRVSLKRFYQSRNKKFKRYYLAVAIFLFTISVSSYTQNNIGQYPISLFVFISLAIVTKLEKFEHDVQMSEL